MWFNAHGFKTKDGYLFEQSLEERRPHTEEIQTRRMRELSREPKICRGATWVKTALAGFDDLAAVHEPVEERVRSLPFSITHCRSQNAGIVATMAAVRSRSLPTRWNSFRPSQCIERKIAGFIADLKVEGVLPHAGILRQPKMNFKVEISIRCQYSFGCHPMAVDYSIRLGLTGPEIVQSFELRCRPPIGATRVSGESIIQ